MGKLGVFDDERSRWIQFDEDAEIHIKLVSKQELRAISKKATKVAALTGADFADIADQKLGRASVLGWRKIGVHDHPGLIVAGKPFPFSAENVDYLMKKSIAFSKFVNENSIDEAAFTREEDETKNG